MTRKLRSIFDRTVQGQDPTIANSLGQIVRDTRIVVGLVAAAVLVCWNVSADAAETEPVSALSVSQTAVSEADSVQDLLFFAPKRPLLIRIRATVRGEGFRSVRRKWAETQFVQLDIDKNGFLEGEEIKRLPTPTSLRPGVPIDSALVVQPDSDPIDGRVSLDECRRYLIAASGNPFSIVSSDSPQQRFIVNNNQNVQVNLFPKLDMDQDGKLSKREIDGAAANLKRYDRNEDDIVDIGELQQALPEELMASRQQLAGALGLIVATDLTDGGIAMSRRLLELYDKAARDPVSKTFRKDERLSRTELLIEPDSFTLADKNNDGKLDRKELGLLTFAMTPTIELSIEAPSTDGKFVVKSLRQVDTATAQLLDLETRNEVQCVLKLGDTEVGLRADSPVEGSDVSLRNLYLERFKNLDQDNNDYLELRELQNRGFAETFFSQADTDGDGKVFQKEYAAQVDREIELSKSTFSLEISSDGPSLFRLIDVNPTDGRLSLRELADASSKLSQRDINGDGIISLTELSITLEGVFKSGTPRVNGPFAATAVTAPNRQMRAIAGAIGGLLGAPPEWFTKMDRNRDGDLSPREFLGRRVLFDKIDTNHDGLISPSEAAEASREAEAAKKAAAEKEAAEKP